MSRANLKAKLNVPPEPPRRDTIGLRSIVHYDPMAPRATTPLMVGQHVVARRPLAGSVHTLYMILDGSDVVDTLISYPDAAFCDAAINRHRRNKATSLANRAIDTAKKNKPRANRVKETA